ncbi:hypothetical protein [Erythrobacter litoralis]|nr:hypothetical protein [Erythrobacter litoralis]
MKGKPDVQDPKGEWKLYFGFAFWSLLIIAWLIVSAIELIMLAY